MEQKIITIEIRRPETREDRLRRRADSVLAFVMWGLMLTALVLASFGSGFHLGAAAAEPVPAPAPVVVSEELRLVPVMAEETAEEPPAVKWDTPLSETELAALLETCEEYHIAPALALGLIEVESSFQRDAVNPAYGCYGYCQLSPNYFPSGLSPEDNIRVGIGYLGEQLERYGELEAGLTAYNAGYDTGSRTYASKVLSAMERWEENGRV